MSASQLLWFTGVATRHVEYLQMTELYRSQCRPLLLRGLTFNTWDLLNKVQTCVTCKEIVVFCASGVDLNEIYGASFFLFSFVFLKDLLTFLSLQFVCIFLLKIFSAC